MVYRAWSPWVRPSPGCSPPPRTTTTASTGSASPGVFSTIRQRYLVYSTEQHEYSNDTFIEDHFLPQEYRFPSLSQSFSTLFHNDPLQRIRIIVRYARFEPSTSAPEVWCVVCFSICLFICFFMVLYLIYYNKILNDAMSSLPHSTIIKF